MVRKVDGKKRWKETEREAPQKGDGFSHGIKQREGRRGRERERGNTSSGQ